MRKILLFLALFWICLSGFAQDKNLLSGKYTKEALKTKLIPQATWTPFPKLINRNGWSKADQKMMQAYLKQAEGKAT